MGARWRSGRTDLPAQPFRPAREKRALRGQPFPGGAGGGGFLSVGSESDIAGSASSEGIVSVVSAGDTESSGGGAGVSTAGGGASVWAADLVLCAPQPASNTEPNASTAKVLSVFISLPLDFLRRLE